MKSVNRHILLTVIAILAAMATLSSCSGTRNLRKPALDLPSEIVAGTTDSLSYSDLSWL